MITIKLKLVENINITAYMKQYTNVSHVAYNRLKQGLSLSQTEQFIKNNMNNITLMNADFIKVATNQVKNLINKDDNIIFGGKHNWQQYNKGLITKEEYLSKKLMPIMARGNIHDTKGNRKFQLDIDNNQIIFKPTKNIKICAKIPITKYTKTLRKLQIACELSETYFTCKLSNEYIWISYDESIFRDKSYLPIKKRIAAIDLNPNYIAIVVRGNQKILHKEIIGIRELNKENKNKKRHEDYEICKRLVQTAKHYRCEYFVYEKLSINSSDKGKGKVFNKVCNQWRRNKLVENINKRCNLVGIKVQPIVAQYSSFVGQINNPDDYDSIAAAIELSRRGLMFIDEFHYKETGVKFSIGLDKVIDKDLMDRWKKKLGLDGSWTYKKLYEWVKNQMGNGYRLFFHDKWFCFRMKSCKSKTFVYNY